MAPRVDFYILSNTGQAAATFACQLAEKAWRSHQNVQLLTSSETEADELNQLLWTFRDISFIPHYKDNTSILTGSDATKCNILINLTDSIPQNYTNFLRILEIITPTKRSQGREHYKFYREHGCTLESHNL